MKIDLIGGPGSGKSTLAALLAQLVAEASGKKLGFPVSPIGIASVSASASRMETAGMTRPVRRARSLKGIETVIQGMQEGGVVDLDDATEPYLLAIQGYLDQANDFRRREAKGEDENPNMTPDAWRTVNVRYHEATAGAAFKAGVHLVCVHREGEVYMLDPQNGRVPGQGIKPRGQSEAGSQADLLIHLHGGLHSKHRYPGDRLLYVISDAAFLATGEARSLPSIRCERDWRYLRRTLAELLRPSIARIFKLDAANRKAWLELEPERDLWPEAAHSSAQGEVLLLADEAETLLRKWDLDGQTAAVKGKRARLLHDIFGVSSPSLFRESPKLTPKVLRAGMKLLEERLARDAEERRAAEAEKLAEIEGEAGAGC